MWNGVQHLWPVVLSVVVMMLVAGIWEGNQELYYPEVAVTAEANVFLDEVDHICSRQWRAQTVHALLANSESKHLH